jgi:hypothetical protein
MSLFLVSVSFPKGFWGIAVRMEVDMQTHLLVFNLRFEGFDPIVVAGWVICTDYSTISGEGSNEGVFKNRN